MTAAPAALVASATMLAGAVKAGGVVSTTLILKDSVDVLPARSVAETLTVVVPSANVLPDAGVELKTITPEPAPSFAESTERQRPGHPRGRTAWYPYAR